MWIKAAPFGKSFEPLDSDTFPQTALSNRIIKELLKALIPNWAAAESFLIERSAVLPSLLGQFINGLASRIPSSKRLINDISDALPLPGLAPL
jgi:hypothetical protein